MISVCIATYNGELYLKEQLESILAQLGCDDEVVISDDGSGDKTIDIISALNDSRIKLVKNKTYADACSAIDRTSHNFENALKQAKGDIIFLADQDDVWMPGKVECCVKALADSDFVVHDCAVTDECLNVTIPSYFTFKHTNLSPFRNLITCTWLGCCMAFRRSVLDASLPFPQTMVPHDLWLGLLATKRFKCKLISKQLLLYRRHSRTASPVARHNCHTLSFKLRYRLAAVQKLMNIGNTTA